MSEVSTTRKPSQLRETFANGSKSDAGNNIVSLRSSRERQVRQYISESELREMSLEELNEWLGTINEQGKVRTYRGNKEEVSRDLQNIRLLKQKIQQIINEKIIEEKQKNGKTN